MKVQRSRITQLLFERCRKCSNVLEPIPDLKANSCWCEMGVCISCNQQPIANANLCTHCNNAYLSQFNAGSYPRPKSCKTVSQWLRKQFNNLYARHGFVGDDDSFAPFCDWWYRAHRSHRLHFQSRGGRFEIHRGNDRGRYVIGDIFMIPQTENNVIRDYCRFDEYEQVLHLRMVELRTYPDILELTGVPPGTACRWVNRRLKISKPEKRPFLSYAVT